MTMHPATQFRDDVARLATEFLTSIVPPERVAEATGRLALAIRQAAVANDRIYQCDRQSIAQAVAMSALTGLQPGGVKPDVYLVPRGKQLQWQVSARGLQKLAARAGWIRMVATCVHVEDEYRVVLGSDDRIDHAVDDAIVEVQGDDAGVACEGEADAVHAPARSSVTGEGEGG